MKKPRWVRRPEGSNWGDFGEDDQLGRLNLITPDRLLAARAEIREGLSFCLSLPLDFPGGRVLSPSRPEPSLRPINPDGVPRYNYPTAGPGGVTDVECDDQVSLALQYSTHWDSLAHVGQYFDADGDGMPEPVYYNGFRAGEDVICPDGSPGLGKGANKLGVDTMAVKPVQARGVLLDLEDHVDNSQGPVNVGFDLLNSLLSKQRITVEEGDIVCLHTGFADLLLNMKKSPDAETVARRTIALDGRDDALLNWITETGLSAIAADNFAVETLPARPADKWPASNLPLHEHCLFKLGIPLGELWSFGQLARWMRKAGRNRFFLTAPPLRLPGAVGAPVTPIGTV